MNSRPEGPQGLEVRATGSNETDMLAAVREVAPLLRAGKLVAFPTETVYGLGANALDADAVARIFAAKQRPSTHPLIVHLASADDLSTVTTEQTPLARKLAEAFWPGPLTLVLPRAAIVPDIITGGLDTVGVRVPAHPVARALIAAAGVPLAAPSANPYTRISPTTAAHVIEQLGDRIDAVLDGGPTDVGIESTVVDACGEQPVLLRPGGIPVAALEQVAGPVLRPSQEHDPRPDAPRPSPGMSERHYAPNARLVEIERHPDGALQLPNPPDGPWAVIAIDNRRTAGAEREATVLVTMPGDAVGYARKLFATLHEVDAAACELVCIERLPDGSDWEAVADRLRRAGLQRAGLQSEKTPHTGLRRSGPQT